MSGSIVQERDSRSTVSATSISLAFSSNVTAANAVHVISALFQAAATTTATFSDNNSGSYTVLDDAYNGGSVDFEMAHGYALNHASGATTVTAGFTPSSEPIHIWIREIAGVKTTGALDGHNVASSSSTSNASLSVSATNSNQPAFISVVGCSEFQQQACTLSGVTQDVQGASWTYAVSGHARVVTTSSNTATVNVGSANDSFQIVMAIFDEIPTGPTITVQPANQYATPGSPVTFGVTAVSSGGALSYQWYENGVLLSGATSSTLTVTPNYPADYGSTWSVVVTDTYGSATSTTAEVIWQVLAKLSLTSGSWLDMGDQDYKSELTLLRWF